MVRFRFLLPGIALLAACAAPPAPAPTPVPTPPPPAATAVPIGVVTVTASALNVRRDPSTSAEVITLVKRGQQLSLLASTESWMKVRLESGETGWVSSQHVTRDGALAKPAARSRKGCPADSDYAFATTPVPAFSDRGAHGLVVVEADVDTSGRVTATRLISNSTGDESLAFLTQKEIKGAKFIAPVRNLTFPPKTRPV